VRRSFGAVPILRTCVISSLFDDPPLKQDLLVFFREKFAFKKILKFVPIHLELSADEVENWLANLI
jgi:hypothetical protein